MRNIKEEGEMTETTITVAVAATPAVEGGEAVEEVELGEMVAGETKAAEGMARALAALAVRNTANLQTRTKAGTLPPLKPTTTHHTMALPSSNLL